MRKWEKIAEFYKALADDTRLEIVSTLFEGEKCVCEINEKLKITQPAISHHLKVLRQAGIVKDSKEGKWIYYSINHDIFNEIFVGEDAEILKSFAEPLRKRMETARPSKIRTDPNLCDRLTNNN